MAAPGVLGAGPSPEAGVPPQVGSGQGSSLEHIALCWDRLWGTALPSEETKPRSKPRSEFKCGTQQGTG